MADNTDLLSTSGDYQAMVPYWTMVGTIMRGAAAMRKVPKFLPQFPSEGDENYKYRRENAKFTNIYRDIVENLASKPFTKEVRLASESVPAQLKAVVEDVDGQGNHLHAFATQYFFNGVNSAIDWLLVDHTRLPEGATLEDERRIGARPFWVRIAATDMLAVYSAVIAGKEQFVYARMNETYVRRADNGIDEETISRARILARDPITDDAGNVLDYAPARFEVWEKGSDAGDQWMLIEEGPITIGVIALVPFVTGRRDGSTWRILPPLNDVAELQIEHYQAETNLKMAKEQTAFPMLAGNGITPPLDGSGKPITVPIGPASVLYAPMNDQGHHGEWQYIEPSATSLKFLSDEVDKLEHQMREIGRIPLTAGTAGMTQITAMLQSQKVSSAVQAWAWLLKDALEKAFKFTAMWLNVNVEPTVFVNTNIAVDLGSNKTPEILRGMRQDGDLSQQTYWEEMRERGVLSQEFEADREIKRLEEELPGDPGDDDLSAAMTPPARIAAE
ncbi:DUF4055 domain-containing protein [Shinella granuli]|uniref:Uncharacterized protein DUF4055 n=1 Tax=Shinella granuli TaxID=323621 RepID=A0A4R2C367_SHIGR|nr:DUF4055 domain-containing protein [Shinella granuli]TCN32979.1 uncharacterized protein DUF4055 [Shinella granuli]